MVRVKSFNFTKVSMTMKSLEKDIKYLIIHQHCMTWCIKRGM